MNTVANRWEFVLDEQFSKQQILRLAETLHHDEAGISDVVPHDALCHSYPFFL